MSEEKKLEFHWVVKNVESLWKEKVSLISPTIRENIIDHEHRLCFIITRSFETETKQESIEEIEEATEEGYMSLYLQNLYFEECSAVSPILNVTFSLIHPIRGEILSQSEIQFNGCSRNLFGFEKFISMEKLREYCFNKFTVLCKLNELKQDFKKHAQFFNQNISSDLNLIFGVDEMRAVPAHKLILALSSYYFQRKFAQVKSISYFIIENRRPEVVIEILRYMYTGKAIYTEKLVYELFEAAMEYSVRGLRSICSKFLLQNLNLGNVIRTLLSCSGYFWYDQKWLNELILKCMRLIDEHLDEVVRLDLCKELLEKNPEILTEVVVHLSSSTSMIGACVEEESSACTLIYKKTFERFANNSDYSDVEIHVNDSKYAAHKVILAAKSAVFDRMFSHNMKETISGVVTIEDIRPQVFEKLLGFMYTNEIEHEDDLIQEILIAADKYEIVDLKLICAKILEEKLTGDNVITTLIFAVDHNAERLKKKCLRFIVHADSPFWNDSSNHFNIPKSILNTNLAESHPYLLYDMLKVIHQNRFS